MQVAITVNGFTAANKNKIMITILTILLFIFCPSLKQASPPLLKEGKAGLFDSVECSIQLKHINPWLAEEAELTAFGMLRDDGTYFCLIQPPDFRNTPYLIVCRSRADIRIKAAAGCSYQVDRRLRLPGRLHAMPISGPSPAL